MAAIIASHRNQNYHTATMATLAEKRSNALVNCNPDPYAPGEQWGIHTSISVI